MTYTFNPALTDDVSLVRFHAGDNNADGHFMEDETIQYVITTQDVGHAVLATINYIITQLSTPGFSVGWMNVNNSDARAGYQALLIRKAQELGLSVTGSYQATSVKNPMRDDSYQTDNNFAGGPP